MDALTAIKNVADNLGYPSRPDLYKGDADRFVTYNYAKISGDNYGDDRPDCNVAAVQVHLYIPLKENFISRLTTMQNALFEAGFTWPDVTVLTEYDETQTVDGLDGIRHIAFECDYEETL